MDRQYNGLTPRETLQDRLAKRRQIRQKKINEIYSLQNTPTFTQSLDRLSSSQQRFESSTPSIRQQSSRQELTTNRTETIQFSDSSAVSLPNPDSFQSSPTDFPGEKSFQLDEKPRILPPIPAPRRRNLPPRSPVTTIFSRTTSEQIISTQQSIPLTRHNSSALTYLLHRSLIETEPSQPKTSWD